jgi:MerR family mercuric resistance operon transcriptional regulator
MKIGQLATACGCAPESIRYYEKIGLLPQPSRQANGYRYYAESHQKWLQFILRSRALGFTQDQVRRLTDIDHMAIPACDQVHDLLSAHVSEVSVKIAELERLKKALTRLKSKCQDGTLNECPVIEELMA